MAGLLGGLLLTGGLLYVGFYISKEKHKNMHGILHSLMVFPSLPISSSYGNFINLHKC